ncbi:MAG: leucine-rich repeat protein [Clostridiales bacterium]|nr:leucine-rich repeat protein [Clostridiales bacterium]
MRIKIISAITALCMAATIVGVALTANGKGNGVVPSQSQTTVTGSASSSTALNVIKYGDKLTQDQVMSQIKAQYLIENGGYKDTDEVVVMVAVDGESLIETFNDGKTGTKSVSEYAESFAGEVQEAEILKKQNAVVSTLWASGLITGVEYKYTTVLNAIAVNTVYGNLKKIEKTAGVKSVSLSDTYNRVEVQMTDSSANPLNVVDIDENTGIYNNTSVYSGLGTVTAVLDSGFDMSHSVFDRNYEGKENKLVIAKTDSTSELEVKNVEGGAVKLADLKAGQTTKGLQVKDVYYSQKIPFAYDYADKDPDVFPYDSEHGTHVAGIIAGEDDTIQGIAPDTQLVLMKVFPDLDSGGKTEDIIAALEDAVRFKVDAINMSLGTSCGFSRECDGDPDKPNVAKVYDAINDSGISLITAASNSYSAGFGGEQGNTNMVTNPDSGTVGSPSTYDAALSVASISGERSRYIETSDGKIFFYNESNDLQKIEQNNFFNDLKAYLKELGRPLTSGKNEFTYVHVSGSGDDVCYRDFVNAYKAKNPGADMTDPEVKKQVLKGKIVLVERGTNSFEEKARIAAEYGAIACIIYNNIDGDITMSMGNKKHIPTISVSRDDGRELAKKSQGSLFISGEFLAGPFMSDFSSWGPTPSLGIKPEITAHGGNIKSAVPGGGYDKLSGTSMACPNLCGIVVLIRQYLKDTYGDELTEKQIKNLTNQLMMSTAGIAINEENNPYSPRKQGAGLADIGRTTTTKGYITVDKKDKDGNPVETDRSKLELGDDPTRSGIYTLKFNVVNMSEADLVYDFSLVGMTENVSTSDDKFVAETPHILGTSFKVEFEGGNGSVSGNKITVNGNAAGTNANDWNKVKVKVTYTLSSDDRKYIDDRFPYGMYVEGFIKLANADSQGVSLNAPFLAFYGDWTEAPMFDKTYYEVETTAHDPSISDDDKVKADYYATTPYGKYMYNYMIPLGTYLYDIDSSKYGEIPATEEKIAISDTLGAIDGISVVLAGLLRGAKEMKFTLTDKVTGEELWNYIDYNALKSFSQGGSPLPYYDYLKLDSATLGLVNNRQYELKMVGSLDYGDGGAANNKRNSYSFDFTFDNEAPVIREVSYRKEYDSVDKKDRYYVDMVIYDNHYAMSVTPVAFTSSSSYTFITENPIPVINATKGGDTKVSFEVTDMLDDILNDALIPNAFAFSVDDYALNSNIYICQLPGTRGDFKFTRTGEKDSSELLVLPATEGEVVDLIQYLYTADETVGENREYDEYLDHLVWTSSNEDIVEVQQGMIKVKKPGRATVTVTEKWEGKQAVILINAKAASEKEAIATALSEAGVKSVTSEKLQSLKFSRFKTLFAFSRAAQTSDIGETGDVNYVAAGSGISMYPGERIQLFEQMKPWYVSDRYEFKYSSTNSSKVTVNKDGEVTAVAEGTSTIRLKAKDKTTGKESPINASVVITVKSPFVIENRTLVAYKGFGETIDGQDGVVKIPDDEGIIYIDSFAFCLYTTDRTVILEEDDYDSNKVPSYNDKITKVIIPEGVEEIRKYAFYNCSALEEVVLPSTVKYLREFSFALDKSLKNIGIADADGNVIPGKLNEKAIVIGAQAFRKCENLAAIDLSNIYAIGDYAFEGCSSLKTVDLKNLRNTGINAFQNCTKLESVLMNENGHTKLSEAMFVNSGLTSVTIYGMSAESGKKTEIPTNCFANCFVLKSVKIANSLLSIGDGAFSRCVSLTDFTYGEGVTVDKFGSGAFFNATGLEKFALPEGKTSLGISCFGMDETDSMLISRFGKKDPEKLRSKLTTLVFGTTTKLESIGGSAFDGTKLSTFEVGSSSYYGVADGGKILTSKDRKIYYLAAIGADFETLTIGSGVNEIASGAFSGTNVKKLTIKNPELIIGDYAFENCEVLETITLPKEGRIAVGNYAFADTAVTIKQDPATGNKSNVFSTLEVINSESIASLGDYAFGISGIQSLTLKLENGATIGEGAFYGSVIKSLTVYVGNGVEKTTLDGKGSAIVAGSIGAGALRQCGKLEELNFLRIDGTNGILDLGATVFAMSTSLSSVTFDNVVDKIPVQAFYACTNLNSVKLYGVKEIGNYAFTACSSLVSVELTKEGETGVLEIIGDGAFSGDKVSASSSNGPQFTGIDLPDSLRYIGEGAFLGAGLKKITIPEKVTFDSDADSKDDDPVEKLHKNGNYVFFACASLDDVVLPESLKKVGKYMFGRCDSLRKVNLENVEYIGEYAFAQTAVSARKVESLLQTIDLSSAKEVGEAAFINCYAINSTVYADNLTKIGAYAFDGTNLNGFYANALEEIGEHAFAGIENVNFDRFVVTENLRKVGSAAFFGCKYLERFTNNSGNDGFDAAVNVGDNVIIDKGSLYMKMDNGKWQLSCTPGRLSDKNHKKIAELEVMEGTYRIDAFAAAGNKNFENIILPESLAFIGNYAFYYNLGADEKLKDELTVYFSSYKAPALENNYNSNISLDEKAKGYGMLHAFPDIFGTELCYCNFIDVLGKYDKIGIVLPGNEVLEGYDSLVYQTYFDVENAIISDKIAMNTNTATFVENAKQLDDIMKNGKVTLDNEAMISATFAAMNASGQKADCLEFGITEEQWLAYENIVNEAKEQIRLIKIGKASEKLKAIESEINALPESFGVGNLEELRSLAAKIGELTPENKLILNMTRYYAFYSSFNDYLRAAEKEADAIFAATGYKFKNNQDEEAAAEPENRAEAGNAAEAALPQAFPGLISGLAAIAFIKRFF